MTSTTGRSGLAQLIYPIEIDPFVRDNWERAPLLVRRETADYFDQVLNLAAVDETLATLPPNDPRVRLARDGQTRKLSDLGITGETSGRITEAIYAEYRLGTTIILEAMHERWPSLGRLADVLGRDLSARVQANVYLTPAGSQGFGAHFDTHDVFVLQASGSKRWLLYGSTPGLPFPHEAAPVSPDALGEPHEEITLHAGDTLYVPRGWVHAAATQDETSLHVTVGVHTITWARLFRLAVDRATEAEGDFRGSLPIGFTHDAASREEAVDTFERLARRLVEMLVPTKTIDDAAELARAGFRPDLRGHLLDLEAVDSITLTTRLRRRPSVDFTLARSESTISLVFNGKSVDLPEHVSAQLEFVCSATTFAAGDLPGILDDAGRVVLVSELLRQGFLTLADGMP